jgi:Ca2+-binding RTX toxin-like protein
MSLGKALTIAAMVCAVTASVAFAATFNGTSGPDTLIGTNSNDLFNAGGGNDIVFGLRGNDNINGGDGNDTLNGDGSCPAGTTSAAYCSTAETGGDGNDNIDGGPGNDTINGQGGADNISGGDGNDTINAGSGPDNVSGGGGNDTIRAADGFKDQIACGSGWDTAYVDKYDAVNRDCENVITGASGSHFVRRASARR